MTTADDIAAVDALTDILRQSRIFSLDPSRRKQIAENLHLHQITADQLAAIWVEAQETAGAKDPQGAFAIAVQSAERLREIYQDIEDREKRKARRSGKASSGLELVSKTNPYGWQDEKIHRLNDHSRPGEWNAYRQAYNLTEDQAVAELVTDVRVHGCSRVELIGIFDPARIKAGNAVRPSCYWDAGAVEILTSRKTAPVPDCAQREVYGA